MDEMKISKGRQEVLNRIAEYEKKGWFDKDVENDPAAPELLPHQVDYLYEKFLSRLGKRIANFFANRYFLRQIKKKRLVIEGVTGKERLSALKDGAVIICNHFSPFDNYVVYHCIKDSMPKKELYKVIREGNYTNFPGLYGYFFRHCNTLPLSSNRRTMMKFMSAVNVLLKRGETVLIYPEQGMWWNYKKPRPFKIGAFKMAYRAGVPVLPSFITMTDDKRLDKDGYPIQRMTYHILPPIYPDFSLSEKAGAEQMKNAAFELCKAKYEEVYKTKLFYTCDEKNALDGKEKGVAIQRIERSIFDEGVLVRCDA
ncbi:MAG: 1-acyl-sn-glycerol-3-phosphate acyltransferase [Clostridiales bacterium]|nr:1-acyl-sn-glycerol-3-phosphate acyltransferase [Clostridiales bacterium]